PEPGQNFARGGKPLADRDKRFQELLQQESRPGRDSQEARDRAAKRLSALEGRPQSSAYHEGEYWQKPKKKAGGGGKGKPDEIKTGSTETGETAAARSLNKEPLKEDRATRFRPGEISDLGEDRATRFRESELITGPSSVRGGIPEQPLEEDRATRFRPVTGDVSRNPYETQVGPIPATTAAPAPGTPPPPVQATGGGVDRSVPALYTHQETEAQQAERAAREARNRAYLRKKFPNAKIPGEEDPSLAQPQAPVQPPAPSRPAGTPTGGYTPRVPAGTPTGGYEPGRMPAGTPTPAFEPAQAAGTPTAAYQPASSECEEAPPGFWDWLKQTFGRGYAAGGVIPDDEETLTRSPRAEEAGYTTSAGGAAARPA